MAGWIVSGVILILWVIDALKTGWNIALQKYAIATLADKYLDEEHAKELKDRFNIKDSVK